MRKIDSFTIIFILAILLVPTVLGANFSVSSFPSIISEDLSVGNSNGNWTNLNFVTATDGQFASVDLNQGTGNNITHYIISQGYNFSSIPSNAQINGIVLNVTRASEHNSANFFDNSIRLIKNNIIGSTDRSTSTIYTTSFLTESHGNSSDKWDENWSVSDINSTNFGAAFSAKEISGPNKAIRVDSFKIIVYYTIFPTGNISYSTTSPTNGNVTATLTPSENVTITNNGGNYTYLFTENGNFTFTFTDIDGNLGTATAVVSNIDRTAPVLIETTPVSSFTNNNTPFYSFNSSEIGNITYLGSCLSVTSTAIAGLNTIQFNSLTDGTYNNCSLIVTDVLGNPTTLNISAFTIDTILPVINGTPSDILNVEMNSSIGTQVNYSNPTANDGVSGTLNVSCNPQSGSIFPLGTTNVTCSATDNANNTATTSFLITIVDTTSPIITNNSENPITIQVGNSFLEPTVNVTDNSGSYNLANSSNVNDSVVGNYTFNFTATDDSGNSVEYSYTIYVVDTTNPILTVPSNITVEATSSLTQVNFSVSATDNYDSNPVITCNNSSNTYPLGETIITCSATDNSGNNVSGYFSITVQDTTAPVILVSSNLTVEATSLSGAQVFFNSSATDNIDGSLIVSCNYLSGATFSFGNTIVNCSAIDNSGNLNYSSFSINVVDTTNPILNVPTNITVNATSSSGAIVTFNVSANDNIDGSLIVSCNYLSGATFSFGNTTINCNASDSSNNTANASFTVNVIDQILPILNVPSNIIVNGGNYSNGENVSFQVNATDNSENVSVSCNYASGDLFGYTTSTVECTATDGSGNNISDSFNITVIDIVSPIINLPSDITVEATTNLGANVTFQVNATDLVDGNLAVICSQLSDSIFSLGTTQVNCSSNDNSGNNVSGYFSITVQDTTAPNLTIPTNITEEAVNENGTLVLFTINASDLVDLNVTILCNYNSGDTFGIGTTTIICSATDDYGNSENKSFTITILDTTKPTIFLIGNDSIIIELGDPYTELGATATDSVDGDLTLNITIDNSSLNISQLGTYQITYNLNDSQGNQADQVIRNVTVQDTTSPVITNNSENPIIIQLGNLFVEPTVNITDNSRDYNLTNSSNVNDSVVGNYTFNFTATDGSGNSVEYSYIVNVIDTTTPNLTILGDNPQIIEVFSNYTELGANATDNSGDLTSQIIISNPVNTSLIGNYTITYNVTDADGNSVEVNRTVIVVDNSSPIITLIGSAVIELTVGTTYNELGANATDNYDGNISAYIIINSSSLDINTLGSYTITYIVNDSSNNSAQVNRTVNINAAPTSGGGGGSTRYTPINNTTNVTGSFVMNQTNTTLQENTGSNDNNGNASENNNRSPITGAAIGGGNGTIWLAIWLLILAIIAYLLIRYRRQIKEFIKTKIFRK